MGQNPPAGSDSLEDYASIARYILPLLAAAALGMAFRSLFFNIPAEGTPAYLLNSANGDTISLKNWETSIGRSKTCDIVLNYETVSRSHAVIARRKKGWILTDTRSSTGTYINGGRINKKAFLIDGDIITFGGVSLVFKFEPIK